MAQWAKQAHLVFNLYEIWKLHQNYLLIFIVKLISEPSWAALFIFLVQQLVLKVKCRNKYLQPRKRSHVWRLVRVEKVLSRLQSSTNGPPSTPQHKSCVAAATAVTSIRIHSHHHRRRHGLDHNRKCYLWHVHRVRGHEWFSRVSFLVNGTGQKKTKRSRNTIRKHRRTCYELERENGEG